MAEDRDFNEVLDEIFLSEQSQYQASYDEGLKAGAAAGNPEGYHMGYHRGAEIGRELGFYLGITEHYLTLTEQASAQYSEKIIKQLTKVKNLIDSFPRTNSEEHDLVQLLDGIRANMNPSHLKARLQLENITKFLTPLLPLVNCHMVEFFTENHWGRHIPEGLRKEVDLTGFSDAVENFWKVAHDWQDAESSALSAFVSAARSHCVSIDNETCLSVDQLERRIDSWGGHLRPAIQLTEFVTSKKGYEVQTMSSLVAALHGCCGASHCVDVGGGRGQLPAVLALGYRVPGLTVDCDGVSLASGMKRDRLIKKQWHAIAKVIAEEKNKCIEETQEMNGDDLHRYANSYVTTETDLCGLVRDNFPEHSNADIKLLLTGLHTCGDLGPSSLRLFTQQPAVAAALNVPCCYHLLTEPLDGSAAWHAAESASAGGHTDAGFPMSEFLRGYQLGRNARMLAAQSIDRVVRHRQLPSRSLYYRALLQVIIKKHLQTAVPEGKLKRVSAKCKNFTEYLKEASAILNVNLHTLPENYLAEFSAKYESQWEKLILFYLLRMCLAQVIESVILLDRLLFLREMGYRDVFLVRLFDPVLSPRCHGIVVRKKYK